MHFETVPITREQKEAAVNAFGESQGRKAAGMTFSLDSVQQRKYLEWNDVQNDIIRERNNGQLKVGCTGGQNTFRFTPTSIGLVVKVDNCLTRNTIDLTDYDIW